MKVISKVIMKPTPIWFYPTRNKYYSLGSKLALLFTRTGFSLLDAEDIELVRPYHWYVDRNLGYVVTAIYPGGKQVKIYQHRLILNPAGNLMSDHKNRRTWDNRRENLRPVTNQENQFNRKSNATSGICGVTWRPKKGKYEAYITWMGKNIYCGLHANKEEAIKARSAKLNELFQAVS